MDSPQTTMFKTKMREKKSKKGKKNPLKIYYKTIL